MNNLTISPVAQYRDEHVGPSLQQCYKDKASTSVKVVTPRTIREEHDRFRCLNHRDELNRSTLELDSKHDRSLYFNHRNELDSAVQIGLGTCTIAYMNAIYREHACYI